LKLIRWFTTPNTSENINKRNFINVQIDGIGVGLASAASPFLPVFLTRLGATSFQVGLLTTMPAVTGFFLAIFLGRFLQKQRKIVPWFSFARLAVISSYALTGLVSLFISQKYLVNSILAFWAIATIPQTILSITFSVVMNAVAGPEGRYELMTRRWSILGFTTAITVFFIGQLLTHVSNFPLNYQIAFISLSIGGLISYYFSSRIDLPDAIPPAPSQTHSIQSKVKEYLAIIVKEKPFVSFVAKRWIYMIGLTMTIPLLPLYFVRQINASDSWIAAINTSKTAVMIIGYFLWSKQSRKRGSRFVLLCTTLGVSVYPILIALTSRVWPMVIYAGIAGIFQAGLDLVFFDELMKTIPEDLSATFVSFAQSVMWLSSIVAPLIASFLADKIGISFALIIGGSIQIIGFILFLQAKPEKKPQLKLANP
jgi:MFS family permease